MRKPLITLMCGIASLGAAAFAFSPRDESAAPIPLAGGEPVLLELFTSQGCSSCPPADRLAARLDQETGLVVVSRPVTYWDRLGWKDTLASEANTTLQRQYARAGLSGRNGVYTPQLVIDGAIGVVGSQERAIRQSVNAARKGDTAAIRVREGQGGGYSIGLGGQTEETAELALLGIASRAQVAIGRGENSGRAITYVNVLRSERVIAEWTGGAKHVALNANALKDASADRYALVLREPGGGKVLAAHWLK
ncbi:DUF1223 domain-containing protein [Erythrobacter sp. HA6-11]